jgi:hypothetical protein
LNLFIVLNLVALLMESKGGVLIKIHVEEEEAVRVWLHVDLDDDLRLSQLSHFIEGLLRLLEDGPFYISAAVEQDHTAGIVQFSLQSTALQPLLRLPYFRSLFSELANTTRTRKLILRAKLEQLLVTVLLMEGESLGRDSKSWWHRAAERTMRVQDD